MTYVAASTSRDVVDVWIARATGASRLGEATSLLNDRECARAAAFRDADLARAFVGAHALVRLVLGNYLGCAAADVPLAATRDGRPYLATPDGLQLSTARSGDCVAVAVSRGRRVGVDLETVAPAVAHREIADAFFTPSEAAAVREDGALLFFRLWVRKEAYAKASGVPLEKALGTDVLQQPPAVHSAGWRVEDLPGPAGCAAAVVTEEAGGRVGTRLRPIDLATATEVML